MDKDKLVLKYANKPQITSNAVFVEKKYVNLLDNTPSQDYSRNQCEFTTTEWATNGRMMDPREMIMAVPVVIKVSSDDALGDDPIVSFKNGGLSIINSFTCDVNSNNVVQQNPDISPYLMFKNNTEMAHEDIFTNSHTDFNKNVSSDWYYHPVLGVNDVAGVSRDNYSNATIPRYGPVLTKDMMDKSGDDYFTTETIATVNYHIYRKTVFIRMKDLPFLEDMPLCRGSKLRLLFTFNQFESRITHTATAGAYTYDLSKKLGSQIPIILHKTPTTDKYINVELSVGKLKHNNGEVVHPLKQCTLYTPAYLLESKLMENLIMNPERNIVYRDVFIEHLKGLKGRNTFKKVLNATVRKIRRLIIIPYLGEGSNGSVGWDTRESLFTTDGVSNPSANFFSQFNVSVSGINIYDSRQFKFEYYLDDLNGAQGNEGGLQDGFRSGVIGYKDFTKKYGYYVVDLSRRNTAEEDKKDVNITITGFNESALDMNALCYIEVERSVNLDITSGKIKIEQE
jgi:hypothetical protein